MVTILGRALLDGCEKIFPMDMHEIGKTFFEGNPEEAPTKTQIAHAEQEGRRLAKRDPVPGKPGEFHYTYSPKPE